MPVVGSVVPRTFSKHAFSFPGEDGLKWWPADRSAWITFCDPYFLLGSHHFIKSRPQNAHCNTQFGHLSWPLFMISREPLPFPKEKRSIKKRNENGKQGSASFMPELTASVLQHTLEEMAPPHKGDIKVARVPHYEMRFLWSIQPGWSRLPQLSELVATRPAPADVSLEWCVKIPCLPS